MSVPSGAYCDTNDLRVGDIVLPGNTSKEQYVSGAAEEIDIALGHKYITPLAFPNDAASRPSKLFVKKINWLLGSARILLNLSAHSDDENLPAYGRQMLREAQDMLKQIVAGDVDLVGVPLLPDAERQEGDFTGPAIFHEDPSSLVEGFYTQFQNPFAPRIPVVPYGFR